MRLSRIFLWKAQLHDITNTNHYNGLPITNILTALYMYKYIAWFRQINYTYKAYIEEFIHDTCIDLFLQIIDKKNNTNIIFPLDQNDHTTCTLHIPVYKALCFIPS